MNDVSITWFRKDLRVHDNPALAAAVRRGQPILPVYVWSPDEEGEWAPGGASRWWLHHALAGLQAQLAELGLGLHIARGPTLAALRKLAKASGAGALFWNRRYEPAIIERDQQLKQALREDGLQVHSSNASLIWEPHSIENRSGEPFRVFTPFWKHLQTLPAAEPVALQPAGIQAARPVDGALPLEALQLLPEISWDSEFKQHWEPSPQGAERALDAFASKGVSGYTSERDRPAVNATSRLSPFLACGQLGPRQVWAALHASGSADSKDGFKFLSEIAWREFGYHLLYHFPHTPLEAMHQGYRDFPWQPDRQLLETWQAGQTGYPIVDAGMRELWRSGWMHNRVRMVVASLLVKHLLQPWQQGAAWFWDTLVDADLASNTMGWQWSAGCGADAAPYFRIFNPTLQGEKFDTQGEYVRRWVPELAALPNQHIHQPWAAPADVLRKAGIKLGKQYPKPIIDHQFGRQRALEALSANKERNADVG
jgi:deoxyribodipyrimidine photo-lyase